MIRRTLFLLWVLCPVIIAGCKKDLPLRRTVSLDGIWQITDGTKNKVPEIFDRTIRVPGLVTMAKPGFEDPAPKGPDRALINDSPDLFFHQIDSLREAYWYRRTFRALKPIPEIAILKVGKAMFGTRVYLNGKYLGQHLPCFTPGYFDLSNAIKPGSNELIIAVGSGRSELPEDMPDGFDYEKERYISGIFDDVTLILCGTPYIRNVQVAPDIARKSAHVRVNLVNGTRPVSSDVGFIIREAATGKVSGEYKMENISLEPGADKILDTDIPVEDCRYWSPGDPFLYTLEVSTSGDHYSTRFGMREFHFDPVTHKAVLNGEPYFLRGTNITLYRFFEDPHCDSLPWDYNWVRAMHKKFRDDMFWNSYRNCIGFPPEEWYNIADEEGFMIQDEFPIWYGAPSWNKWVKKINSEELTMEFREWMEERWNHPSVIIWDADNETLLSEPSIDSAIARVRGLDLSRRSWDNSYSPNREPGDIFESHPYHFSDPDFRLSDLAKVTTIPQGNYMKNPGTFPVIINEYGWLWLNRDGSPTTLTRKLYENLLGAESTPESRWEVYARYSAAETEFWRCHRNAAGVLHFTSLGYDRPDGQTCDNWIDLPTLTWEPRFKKYMHDAFSPLGLMVDFWDGSIMKGMDRQVPVIVINDLEKEWKGKIRFRIISNENVVLEKTQDIVLDPFGQVKCTFHTGPDLGNGKYTMEVSLVDTPFGTIRSIRDFRI